MAGILLEVQRLKESLEATLNQLRQEVAMRDQEINMLVGSLSKRGNNAKEAARAGPVFIPGAPSGSNPPEVATSRGPEALSSPGEDSAAVGDPTALLLDRNKAFDAFRRSVRRSETLDDGREAMKQLVVEAKEVGELANAARASVQVIQKKIEKARLGRENAVPPDTPEIATLNHTMEVKISTYKKSMERLKWVKAEIEKYRSAAEENKDILERLQRDFEAWYLSLQAHQASVAGAEAVRPASAQSPAAVVESSPRSNSAQESRKAPGAHEGVLAASGVPQEPPATSLTVADNASALEEPVTDADVMNAEESAAENSSEVQLLKELLLQQTRRSETLGRQDSPARDWERWELLQQLRQKDEQLEFEEIAATKQRVVLSTVRATARHYRAVCCLRAWRSHVQQLCAERALLRAKNRLALGRRRHASSLIHSVLKRVLERHLTSGLHALGVHRASFVSPEIEKRTGLRCNQCLTVLCIRCSPMRRMRLVSYASATEVPEPGFSTPPKSSHPSRVHWDPSPIPRMPGRAAYPSEVSTEIPSEAALDSERADLESSLETVRLTQEAAAQAPNKVRRSLLEAWGRDRGKWAQDWTGTSMFRDDFTMSKETSNQTLCLCCNTVERAALSAAADEAREEARMARWANAEAEANYAEAAEVARAELRGEEHLCMQLAAQLRERIHQAESLEEALELKLEGAKATPDGAPSSSQLQELDSYAALVDRLRSEVAHERSEREASASSLATLRNSYRLLLQRTSNDCLREGSRACRGAWAR
eukprot:g15835.t1